MSAAASSAKASAAPLPWLLLLLSVTTGLVDAISVLGLGKVFTANMTGNIVFLGFATAGAPGFRVAPYLAAIAATIEAVLLWIAAGISVGFDIPARSPGTSLYAIIALTGLAMGFRNATIRQLKVPDLTTTVLTLTGIAADSSLAGGSNPNWARRIGSVAAIFLGAAIGAAMVIHGGLTAPLVLAGALVLAGTAACALHPAVRQPAAG